MRCTTVAPYKPSRSATARSEPPRLSTCSDLAACARKLSTRPWGASTRKGTTKRAATAAKTASARNASSRPRSSPDEDRGRRHEHQRIDLRGECSAEQREGGQSRPASSSARAASVSSAGHASYVLSEIGPSASGDRREDQQGDPEACRRHTEPDEQPPEQQQRGHTAQRHQALERRVVVRRAEGRRRQEHGKSPGRVLHEEVPIRNAPVEDRGRESLVEMDVAESLGPKEPSVRNGAGGEIDRNRRGRRPQPGPTGSWWCQGPGRSRRRRRSRSSSSSSAPARRSVRCSYRSWRIAACG